MTDTHNVRENNLYSDFIQSIKKEVNSNEKAFDDFLLKSINAWGRACGHSYGNSVQNETGHESLWVPIGTTPGWLMEVLVGLKVFAITTQYFGHPSRENLGHISVWNVPNKNTWICLTRGIGLGYVPGGNSRKKGQRQRQPDICLFKGEHNNGCNKDSNCSCVENRIKITEDGISPNDILVLIETKTYITGAIESVVQNFKNSLWTKENKPHILGNQVTNKRQFILCVANDSTGRSKKDYYEKVLDDSFSVCLLDTQQRNNFIKNNHSDHSISLKEVFDNLTDRLKTL